MGKILKFFMTILVISLVISVSLFVGWVIASIFVIKYLLSLRGKYNNPKDFFWEWKNIVSIILAVVLFVVVPVSFMKSSKAYDEELKVIQQEEAAKEEAKKIEDEKKQKAKERANVLNAKSRVEKAKKDGKDISEGIELTEEEISNYGITDEEIDEFDSDVKKVIIEIENKEIAEGFKRSAKLYVKEQLTNSYPDVSIPKYSFNSDRTICTMKGTYTSKNQYGANVRGEYSIDYDVATGQVVDEFIGNEKVRN